MNIQMKSPWVLHHRKLCALFGKDPGVKVELDESQSVKFIVLRVESMRKAAALARLMPSEVEFGNVKTVVKIVPANDDVEPLPANATILEVMEAALAGNGACKEIRPVSKGLFRDLVYVVFENAVVQYEADNLADVNGNVSTLMECIAREVFSEAVGALFCTSAVSGDANTLNANTFDKPLGEWP